MDAGPSRSRRYSESSKSEWSDSNADEDFEPGYRADDDENDLPHDPEMYDHVEGEPRTPRSKAKGKEKAGSATGTTSPVSPIRIRVDPLPSGAPLRQTSRSWTDLNMSIIVALISPIGNWLTGSDHVKHLCLLLLLVYYLHQLIEVPWQLYNKSRSRHLNVQKLHTGVDEVKSASHHAAELAASELRRLELFYLALSVFAPFLGAHLIRHIFTSMDVDSLSWFSQTLFVLATGVRPWSHLVERLQQRTSDLQDTVDTPLNAERHQAIDEALNVIVSRLDALEEAVQDVHARTDQMETTKEIHDDLTEAVGDLDRLVHRHERRMELARVAHNNRLSVLETGLQRLEERGKRSRVFQPSSQKGIEFSLHTDSTFFARMWEFFYYLSETMLAYVPSYMLKEHRTLRSSRSSSYSPLSSPPDSTDAFPPAPTSTPSPTLGMSMPYFNGTPLETIPEDSDSEDTYVSEISPSSPRTTTVKLKPLRRSRSRSLSASRRASEISPSYRARAIEFAAAVAGWPYRAAVGVLTSIMPSSLSN
ncbi:hypothetical protein BDY19DRAFT_1058046 [Irpex rosettiformis]|uniref:Uncharacterized protein n=1 Tax=Irpex rosettiformis TaxID=378272 RepID=A0ACB8TZQ1_9APHY|nr:hypothetical protein BDY19DRAFT_1058046 [Irpex rosettiformis]